ncbi:MAG: oligoendopeptidase F [Lachnospira sp.]
MQKAKQRSEIAQQDKWRIEDIYATDEAWEADYNECIRRAKEKCVYQGRLAESAQILYQALKESDEADLLVEHVYVYAFMKYYEDTANAVYQEMSGRAQAAVTKLSEKYAFLTPEILAIDQKKMQEYLNSDTLALYCHALEDILAKKEHALSEKEERLLAMAGQVTASPNEIFSKFNNADVKFGTILDEDGNEVELTNGRYSVFMESNDRSVRENAFKALYRQYGNYKNTLAATYYANVKQACFYAKARKYDSTLQMYLSGSFIPEKVYHNLIETVHKNLDKMHTYVSLRKQVLGVDELHFYDIYAPMVSNITMKIPYEEAKDIALKALAPLGEEYLSKVKEGFESGWVDVYENTGKRTGAFSWGTYGVHPYVFLNYTDTLNDVFTLVHEMGHAMHTYYSNANQPYPYAGYRIFVAEVASTCNEALLMQYLLKNCTDLSEKKYLMNHYFEQFKGTLFRQTMFAEFEMITHKMAEDGEVLNAQALCDVYRKLNEEYFGEDMVIDDEIALEWSRIPHFYTPFYVYQYATGYSAAIAIASKIFKGDEKTLKGYKQFLSGGCSMHPIDLLKLCGIDMESPQVIQEALDVFGKLLEEWD